jgi:hypothetical protein
MPARSDHSPANAAQSSGTDNLTAESSTTAMVWTHSMISARFRI